MKINKIGLTESQIDLFWDKVTIADPEECWLWNGAITSMGYGNFRANGRNFTASRLAYMIAYDLVLLESEFACHRCDNPPCCNPYHIFIGSQKDNLQDAKAKNRMKGTHPSQRGELNPRAIMTPDQVRSIKESKERTYILARMYKVGWTTIYNIRKGNSWRDQ